MHNVQAINAAVHNLAEMYFINPAPFFTSIILMNFTNYLQTGRFSKQGMIMKKVLYFEVYSKKIWYDKKYKL
ncbi:hypothetical protein EROP_00450 [Erysipelotrichaceae bacterium OPF54]|nr:hypothetical protein EROP_00450 [Erysipelotrichaceae bacterium OPF54]